MNDNRDAAEAWLFTCERCGFWPMAYQGPRPFGGETSFACPGCKETAVFRLRQGARMRPDLPAVAS
jgi:predicted RNA-binding Zn-ribbon protein involved in translation (DUF1610 family)